ncbi:MAG: LysR substrate-binding domain-containing protein [Kistimonas sp.]|nr:LysR substrate-binding domain-containing protein [Kistimonas sp.]
MKLQQLRYIWEVAHHNLNVSATAQSLYTSQPGVSKQIRLLEDELGVEVFVRSGKHLIRITPAGEKIIKLADEILCKTRSIKQIAQDFTDESRGFLSISCTRLQARHALPDVTCAFMKKFPSVTLRIRQGEPSQVAEMLMDGEADIAVCTELMNPPTGLINLPCYQYNTGLVVPDDHPLTQAGSLTLADLENYPIVVCSTNPVGYPHLHQACVREGVTPVIACQVADTDLVKHYVRLGLGAGLIPSLAWEQENDRGLVYIDVGHLFPSSTVYIGLRRGTFSRSFLYDFVSLLASHLTQNLVERALLSSNSAEIDDMLKKIRLPFHPEM